MPEYLSRVVVNVFGSSMPLSSFSPSKETIRLWVDAVLLNFPHAGENPRESQMETQFRSCLWEAMRKVLDEAKRDKDVLRAALIVDGIADIMQFHIAPCEGCQYNAPGQRAHMGPNGCLE